MSSHYSGTHNDGQQYYGREDYVEESRWHPRATTIVPADDTSSTRPLTPGQTVLRRVVIPSGQMREWELQDEKLDLRRQLQDSQRTVCCLQTERDELKTEVAELQAQLSYATGALTTRFRKELDDIRAEDSLDQKLKDQNTMQSAAIKRLTTEASGQYNTISELKSEIFTKNNKISKLQRERQMAINELNNYRSGKNDNKPPPQLSKKAKRRLQREASLLPLADESSAENARVLISKFVQDSNLTDIVRAQISRIGANVGERNNIYALLYSENRGIYYCIHEACEKGKLASQRLRPGQSECPVRGANCNFMVKAATVGLLSVFQIYNPKVPDPNIQQSKEVQSGNSG
ncbi:hypothetical protein ACHAPA_002262 [Fusarium lateritium]